MSGPRPLTITGAIAGSAGPAEPVVTPGNGGKRIPPERALEHVFEHSLGLHTTRRL